MLIKNHIISGYTWKKNVKLWFIFCLSCRNRTMNPQKDGLTRCWHRLLYCSSSIHLGHAAKCHVINQPNSIIQAMRQIRKWRREMYLANNGTVRFLKMSISIWTSLRLIMLMRSPSNTFTSSFTMKFTKYGHRVS